MAFFSSLSPADGIWGRGREPRPLRMQEEIKQWGGSCFHYHQAHWTNTFSRPPGRATGNSRRERPGRKGGMRDRVESLKVMLVGAYSQTCKDFEEAWE